MKSPEQQNRTGQISLFAPDYSMKQREYLGMVAEWYGRKKEAERLAENLKALSRRSDPITSKHAAKKASKFRIRHASKIYAALKDFGSMTYKEIAKRIGMEPVAVARRRKEMEESKLIEVYGERDGCQLWRAI